MQVATKKKLFLFALKNENIRCRWIFALSHDVEVLVDGKEVKDSGNGHVEQGYIVVVTPDVFEPSLLVNVHGWTTATGGFLLEIGGFERLELLLIFFLRFLLSNTVVPNRGAVNWSKGCRQLLQLLDRYT